jgi:superfamily II DNA or RNA helicase
MDMLIDNPRTKEECIANKDYIQKVCKDLWLETGFGTLQLCTGAGKSKIAIDIIEHVRHEWLKDELELQILLVTPTEELRDVNWPDEFKKWGVEMTGIKCIAYASLGKQNLSKYDLIVYDEYHRTTLNNLQKLQDELTTSHKMILGLSATLPLKPRYAEEMERFKLMNELCPTIYKLTIDDGVQYGIIADFEIHVLKFFMESIKLDYVGGSKLKPFKQSEKSMYNWLTKKLQFAMIQVRANPSKKGFEFKAVGERCQFIYNLNSKLALGRACLERFDTDKRTLVFAGSIDHANQLCGNNVYHSESSREYLDKFQNKEVNLLGSVKAMDEGLNITDPDQALIMQVTSVERSLIQRVGRLVRKRYDNIDFKAKIVILVAANTVDEQWYNKASENLNTSRITETLVKVP